MLFLPVLCLLLFGVLIQWVSCCPHWVFSDFVHTCFYESGAESLVYCDTRLLRSYFKVGLSWLSLMKVIKEVLS